MIYRKAKKQLLGFILLFPLLGIAEPLMRDPFLSAYISEEKLEQLKSASPLTKYSLEQLSMVGIVNTKNKMWGVIKTPDGYQRVQMGALVGKHAGKIVAITSKKILIEEHEMASTLTGSVKIIELKLRQIKID